MFLTYLNLCSTNHVCILCTRVPQFVSYVHKFQHYSCNNIVIVHKWNTVASSLDLISSDCTLAKKKKKSRLAALKIYIPLHTTTLGKLASLLSVDVLIAESSCTMYKTLVYPTGFINACMYTYMTLTTYTRWIRRCKNWRLLTFKIYYRRVFFFFFSIRSHSWCSTWNKRITNYDKIVEKATIAALNFTN